MNDKNPKNDDLLALTGQAQTLEAEAASDGAAGPGAGADAGGPPPGQSNAELLTGTFHMLRETGCILGGVESPRRVLDDNVLAQLGGAWGAVCDKRGWDLSALMGNYGPEVTAVLLSITVVQRLNAAVRAELAAREPKPADVVQQGEAQAAAA